MLKRLHYRYWLPSFKSVIDKFHSKHGEVISFNSLCYSGCLIISLDELIGEVDNRVLFILDQETSSWQEVHLLASLEVSKPGVLSFLLTCIKIFELPLTLVKVPKLLLGAATHQQLLLLKVFFLNEISYIINCLPVWDWLWVIWVWPIPILVESCKTAELSRFKELFFLRWWGKNRIVHWAVQQVLLALF